MDESRQTARTSPAAARLWRFLRVRHGLHSGLLILLLLPFPAMAFVVETLDGQRVELLDSTPQEQPTLVFIWSLTCIPCEQQKPLIDAFYQQHGKTGAIAVLGLALDGPAHQQAIADKVQDGPMSYPNFIALDDVIGRQLEALTGRRILATPSYLLFDRQGEFAGLHMGPVSQQQLESLLTAQRDSR